MFTIKVPIGAKGKPVKIRRGPAAVIGDETGRKATETARLTREGAGSRMSQEPEDLP